MDDDSASSAKAARKAARKAAKRAAKKSKKSKKAATTDSVGGTSAAAVPPEVERHRQVRSVSAAAADDYPFPVDEAYHCETPPEAYRDIIPALRSIGTGLGRTPA